MVRKPIAVLATALLALAGCLEGDAGQDGADDGDAGSPETQAHATSVVAVIDTGATPYHEHFQRDGGIHDDVLARLTNAADGEPPQRILLTEDGSFEDRLSADQEIWDAMERGVLYYFEGTNILGISFDSSEHPVLDDAGHGTATTGAVLDANPDAIVVLVEGLNSDSEAWAAAQPWIDIISMSYGPTGSIPASGPLVFGLDTHTATRTAWNTGKLPVGAADNTPAPAPNDETAGPPWVIGVGGDDPDSKCREHISAMLPDFTADFTQNLPMAGTVDEYRDTSGTSFSTPATAGTLSGIVQDVRQAWGHPGGIVEGALALGPDGERLTNIDVRGALNQTAYYFDFVPCTGGTLPVNPAAPWLQMGWGHVGPELINATVAHLLGLEPAPDKPMEAALYQQALFEYRRQLWSVVP